MNRVIVIANDFGFGPLSNAISLTNGLQGNGFEVRLATSGFNDSLLTGNEDNIDTVTQLRDVDAIRRYFSQFDNHETVIVSVMNRFAITAANQLNIPVIFVDDLYWFWKNNRPKEYDSATYQVRCVFPWEINKIQPTRNIRYGLHEVSLINSSTRSQHYKNKPVLFSLNGLMTPFHKPEHDIYVPFAAAIVSQVAQNTDNVIVTGPRYAYDQISSSIPSNITYESLSKDKYRQLLQNADRVILNGGMNSFLEATYHGATLMFSLPSNQSQYGVINRVAQEINVPIEKICPLLNLISNHQEMLVYPSEKEALDEWSEKIRIIMHKPDAGKIIAREVDRWWNNAFDIQSHLNNWKDIVTNRNNGCTEIVKDILRVMP